MIYRIKQWIGFSGNFIYEDLGISDCSRFDLSSFLEGGWHLDVYRCSRNDGGSRHSSFFTDKPKEIWILEKRLLAFVAKSLMLSRLLFQGTFVASVSPGIYENSISVYTDNLTITRTFPTVDFLRFKYHIFFGKINYFTCTTFLISAIFCSKFRFKKASTAVKYSPIMPTRKGRSGLEIGITEKIFRVCSRIFQWVIVLLHGLSPLSFTIWE